MSCTTSRYGLDAKPLFVSTVFVLAKGKNGQQTFCLLLLALKSSIFACKVTYGLMSVETVMTDFTA